MAEKRTHLVVGLGNPGNTYENTRHNAGFLVIDALADHYAIPVNRHKFDAVIGRGKVGRSDVILAKPMAFMNRSGPPVQSISRFFRIQREDILVIHDDIDLGFGRLKIKQEGGDGGHKGLRSIMEALGGGQFPRLRIGVGRPGPRHDVSGHVLSGFSTAEDQVLDQIIETAREAAVTVLCEGTKAGMNRFNDRRTQISR